MKKLFTGLFCLLILCGCAKREDYYIFSFDDYSLAVGYDDGEYLKVAFDVDIKDELEPFEVISDLDIYYLDKYFAIVDISNDSKKNIESDKAVVTRFKYFLKDIPFTTYKINDIELSKSIKDNCEQFNGEYIDRNGKACVIGQVVDDKQNVIIMKGDIFAIDDDELDNIEIYVEKTNKENK